MMKPAKPALLPPALMAGAACLAALVPGLASAEDRQTPGRPPEKIYAITCGYCHGHNVGPVIRGRQLPPEAIAAFVRSGNGAMPAFKPTEITDEELTALAQWVSASEADPKEHGK